MTHLAGEVAGATHGHSIARRVVVQTFEPEIAPLLGEVQKAVQRIYMMPLLSEYTTDNGPPIEIVAFDSERKDAIRSTRRHGACSLN